MRLQRTLERTKNPIVQTSIVRATDHQHRPRRGLLRNAESQTHPAPGALDMHVLTFKVQMHGPKDSLGSCRDFESPSLSLKSKIMARERHGAQPAEGGICLKTFKEAAQEAEISLHFWPPLIYFHKLAKVISLKQKRKKRKVYFAMSLLFLKCISGCHCSQDKIQNPLRGSRACLTRHPAPCCFSRPA